MRNTQIGICFLLLSFCLIISNVRAQNLNIAVDGQRIVKTVKYLSSDKFLGRKPNTPEFNNLQEWVVKQFQNWKLEPGGDNGTFYQAVPINRDYAVTYGTPSLRINGREFFSRYGDFKIDTRSTAGLTVKEPIIFAGYGISAPQKGLDEYNGLNVQGKIVLVLKGNPSDFTPPRPRLLPRDYKIEKVGEDSLDNWTTESLDSTKVAEAYHKGAAGIIFYNPEADTDFRSRFARPTVQSPFGRDFIVVSEISEGVFNWILWRDAQMSSRGFRTWLDKIRSDIREKNSRSFDTGIRIELSGYETTLLRGEKFENNEGRNIIAKISGSDPVLKDQYIIVGAHLDHVGVRDGRIYNGAEDNASGSAVVIELARLMKTKQIETKRTVIFCLWTAEEMGLIGSNYWVENPTDDVVMDEVVTYFNLDMVGIGDYIEAPGALNFPSIWEVIKRDQDPDILEAIKPDEGGPGGSDHSAFIKLGIEALALMTHGKEGHPDYHDTGDDSDKMNPYILSKICSFVLQGVRNLANETTAPLFIPERQNIYNGMNWSIAVINPDLGVSGSWSHLEAQNTADLSKLMIEKVKNMKKPQDDSNPYAAWRRRFGGTPRNTGLSGADVFKHDIHLLEAAKEILNFGRLDIHGDDGIWFNQGITEAGIAALATLRRNQIALHLLQPIRVTLDAVLEKSREPFLISGFDALDDSLIAKIKRRKVLLAVDFNPGEISQCVEQLNILKAKFGGSENLILNLINDQNLSSAQKELYLQLVKSGWEKQEIYALGGVGETRRSNGNLDVLPGGRAPFPGSR